MNKALERRADYQSAIMGIEMAKLQTDMARSKYLPQLAVGIKEKYGTTLLNVDGKARMGGLRLMHKSIYRCSIGEKCGRM